MPFLVGATGRHEGELSRHVTQRRSRQALDKGVAIASHALLAEDKKMPRAAKAELHPLAPGRVHDLRRHAVPGDDVALHDVGGMDLNALIGLLDHGPIEQPVSLRTGLPEMPLTGTGAPVQ